MSRPFLAVPLVVLALLGAALAADPRTGVPAQKYLVDVHLVAEEQAKDLAAAGFDVAGIDRGALLAGVVTDDGGLRRLSELGYVYGIREKYGPGPEKALSNYTDPAEMSAFIDQVVAAYPNLARKIVLEGTLFEGQKQYAVHITKDVSQPNLRPAFMLDGQHHAREVMTAEVTKDAIDYLTSKYATDANVKRWVDNINIYVVPIVNPDGAMYVFQHDAGWRKNRNPACTVDLNRNYPSFWGACNGSSGDCSSDTMRGFTPASEPETQGMLQMTTDAHPFFALSYHSYGEYLMYSYGCTDPDEKTAMDEIAQALNGQLLNDAGQTGQWRTGPIWSTIYSADGGSVDTQYAVHGAYAYVIEVNTSSFQPDYATWRTKTVNRQRTAWQYFLTRTLDNPQIHGRVTDGATGQPIAATVAVDEVVYTHGESARHADGRGLYQWLARSGQTYHLSFSAPGYCTTTRTVTVGSGPATLDVQLGHPAAPAGVTAAGAGDNRIDLSWAPVDGATEYHVLRSLEGGPGLVPVGVVAAPGTSFSDTTVSGGVTYSYVVRAFQFCESPDSAAASASTTGRCTLPPAFAGLASATNAATDSCAVNLSWSAAQAYCAGPVTYAVYRSATSPVIPSAATLVASGLAVTAWTDHGALAGFAPYFYVVHALDAASGAEDTNVVTRSAVPTGPNAPGTWSDDAGDTGSAQLVATAPFSVQPSGGSAGPRVYATGSYNNNVCATLTTPPILLQAAGSTLTFASKYDLETNYDAGIVEVATGPGFSNWTKLATVNYPDSLTYSGNSCGIATGGAGTVFSRTIGTPAYSASPYSGSLAAYAGQQIELRFRFGSDGGVVGAGWWIDDVRVTNALIPTSCVAAAPPNPQEIGPALTARRGAGSTIDVAFVPACGALDTAAYWGSGAISAAPQWTGAACALGTSGHAVFDPGTPAAGSMIYFVLVGQTATAEGSYGQGSSGERPEATGVGACDRPRVLGGTCP